MACGCKKKPKVNSTETVKTKTVSNTSTTAASVRQALLDKLKANRNAVNKDEQNQ